MHYCCIPVNVFGPQRPSVDLDPTPRVQPTTFSSRLQFNTATVPVTLINTRINASAHDVHFTSQERRVFDHSVLTIYNLSHLAIFTLPP